MNKHQLLEIAEYISIFAALSGSVIAVTTGQIIYATVPMALSLLLNLVRRSQFEEQLQQRTNRTNAEMFQQILNNIQSLETVIIATSSQDFCETIQDEITALNEKIDSLDPETETGLINDNISELNAQYQNLQDTLNGLVYRMLSGGSLGSWDAKPEEKGIANIVTQYQQDKAARKKNYQVGNDDN